MQRFKIMDNCHERSQNMEKLVNVKLKNRSIICLFEQFLFSNII